MFGSRGILIKGRKNAFVNFGLTLVPLQWARVPDCGSHGEEYERLRLLPRLSQPGRPGRLLSQLTLPVSFASEVQKIRSLCVVASPLSVKNLPQSLASPDPWSLSTHAKKEALICPFCYFFLNPKFSFWLKLKIFWSCDTKLSGKCTTWSQLFWPRGIIVCAAPADVRMPGRSPADWTPPACSAGDWTPPLSGKQHISLSE
jgi:hypothetical protein